MPETVISSLSPENKLKIKSIVKSHYRFLPHNDNIEWIDDVLRNHYVVLHDQRIILELVAHELSRPLLKHRDRLGSTAFERILLDKTIFR